LHQNLLEENCRHRPVQYLNNVLEQDHRAIKRRVRASQHFRSFWGAWRTIAGYEAIHMIRKGQADTSGAPPADMFWLAIRKSTSAWFWCKLLKGSVSCDNCRDDGTGLGTRFVQGTAL
jgi:hypothetical protein